MNKSLYSLMLMDDVVEQIDRMAMREGTNRSNLVNQILAEYVSMMTPEKRIDSIFQSVERLIAESNDLVPFFTPHQQTMSLKSSLQYKYRPTIKYVVSLFLEPGRSIGELNVNFRTQSEGLLNEIADFFRLWKRLEDAYISHLYEPGALRYGLHDGKLLRTIAVPTDRDYTNEELGTAISEYIKMFDELMKGYLAGNLDAHQLEARYVSYLNRGIGLI